MAKSQKVFGSNSFVKFAGENLVERRAFWTPPSLSQRGLKFIKNHKPKSIEDILQKKMENNETKEKSDKIKIVAGKI